MQFSTHNAAASSGLYNKEFSTSLNYTPFNDSLPRSPRRKEQKIYRFGRANAIHEMSGRAINKHARTGCNRVSSSRFLPLVSRSQLRLVIPPTFDRDARTFPRFPYVCLVPARYVAGRRRDRVPIVFSRSLSRPTPSGFSTIRARRVITTVTRPFSARSSSRRRPRPAIFHPVRVYDSCASYSYASRPPVSSGISTFAVFGCSEVALPSAKLHARYDGWRFRYRLSRCVARSARHANLSTTTAVR